MNYAKGKCFSCAKPISCGNWKHCSIHCHISAYRHEYMVRFLAQELSKDISRAMAIDPKILGTASSAPSFASTRVERKIFIDWANRRTP